MKRNLINFAIEGFILSLLNLAFMAITNNNFNSRDYFYVNTEDSVIWYFSLALFSLVISFVWMKLKKVNKNKKWLLAALYTVLTALVDLSFRSKIKGYDGLDYTYWYWAVSSYALIWMFIIVIAVWVVFRYEVDDLKK
ncbi:hypothetical protein [Prevotella nigrescens]|uniref:hypothetical protein n=1 Tax=Prevotella nigrescens TaxID=28133 RepID=UPI00242E9B66|nr:hypothetical protein [Prevotella nigrescens]